MKKRIITIVLLAAFFICLLPISSYAGSSYDVEKVIGAKVTPGTYKINITRESQDMYKITGQALLMLWVTLLQMKFQKI